MHEESLISANDICVYHNIEMSFIHSLHDFGLLEMVNKEETIFIRSDQLSQLEKLIRMHYELNINLEGIDVICHLLKRLEEAQLETQQLRMQLKFYQLNE